MPSAGQAPANRVELDGVLRASEGLRYTPAGVAIVDATLEQAADTAERIRRRIEAIDTSAFAPGARASASIGLASRTGFTHHERMIYRADERLYAAKRAGRNRVET